MKIETLDNNRAKLTIEFQYARILNRSTEGRRLAARAAWKLMHEFNNNCDTVTGTPQRLPNQIPATFEVMLDTSSRQWKSNAMRNLSQTVKNTAAEADFKMRDVKERATQIHIAPE